ncbi:MAG: hypothetical protein AAF658_15880, partial [Myxococcota bacterium]
EFPDANQLPGVSYQNIELGLSGRYELEEFSAFADLSYAFIRRAGNVGDDLFPNAAVGGLRVRAGVAYPLFWSVEVFGAGGYDRFFYDLRPQRGDEFIAGGALDQQFSGELGFSYAY